MSVNSKMTTIADKIRSLLGVTGMMGLDAVAANLETERANVSNAFTAVENMGGTVPSSRVSGNLAGAINSIPAGVPAGLSAVTVVPFVPGSQSMNAKINITHNLGVIPDFYIVYTPEVSADHTSVIFELGGNFVGEVAYSSFRAAFEGTVCVESGHKMADLRNASATTISISPATNSTWNTVTYYLIVGKTKP